MSALPRRRLGRTDLEITTLGLGAWAIGGPWAYGWGPQDDAESVAAIHRAVERGVNWIDTAAVYGLGHSELVVGKAVAALSACIAALPVHQVRTDLERRRSEGRTRGCSGPNPFVGSARPRSGGWACRASTSISFTGRMRMAQRSRIPGT